jgi:hypothetical protein
MSERYAKLSSNIVFSSMWEEDAETCKVWITLLALKDRDGLVDKNITGIARLAKIPLDKCEWAFKKFQEPDPNSTTTLEEGRRIRKTDKGWLIINHELYQECGWSDEKRVYERKRKADYRERLKPIPASVVVKPDTTVVPPLEVKPAVVEKVKKSKATLEEVKLCCAKAGLPESDAEWFWNKCEANGWTNGGKPILSWPHTIASWKSAGYMPSQKASKPLAEQRVNRNIGNCNEGKENAYNGLKSSAKLA